MIKHIFKQIWAERRLNSWLLLEMIAVFFFLLIMCDFLWVKVKNYTENLGFDHESTFVLQLKLLNAAAPDYVDPEQNTMTPYEELIRLTDQIKLYPDIESLSLSIHTEPFTTGGYWENVTADTTSIGPMRIRQISPSYFDVFRMTSPNGTLLKIQAQGSREAIITESLAKKLYGSTDKAIGRDIRLSSQDENDNARVVAVCANYKMHDFEPYNDTYFEILRPEVLENNANDNVTMIDVIVRTRPGTEKHFAENFEIDMGERLRINNLYISSIVSSEKLRDNVVGKIIRQDVLIMTYVLIFVLIVAFLGIFGSFWLRTRQRKCEIGIRMAMGASKKSISFSMMLEGLCLLLISILPAFIVYFNLLNAEVLNVARLDFTVGRVLIATGTSLLTIIIIIVGGIYQPAMQAASTPPVEALRDE